MLRRDLREIYNSCSPDRDTKERILETVLQQRPKDMEIKGKKWKPRGQAGAWILISLCVVLILAAAGYAFYSTGLYDYCVEMFTPEVTASDPQNPEEPVPPTTVPPPTVQKQLSYQPLAAKYVQAIQEDWDMVRCEEEDISYLVMFLGRPEDLSCTITDLDGNGIDEFIVTDGNVIYDLYTCANGEYVHLVSGAERNSYTLTADNMIVNTGNSGAGKSQFSVYLYYGVNLIPVELLICDASRDAANPWFRGIDNPEDVKPITVQEAREIIDLYPAVPIPGGMITAYD